MDFKRKQALVYAKGFVGSFVDEYAASLPEDAPKHLIDQATELSNVFEVMSNGITQLLAENDALETKLMLITQAVNTPTI